MKKIEIQKICNCSEDQREKILKDNIFFDPLSKGWEKEEYIYGGERCSLCKREYLNEEMNPLKICFVCGDKMESNCLEKEIDTKNFYPYKCSSCGYPELTHS